MTKGPGGRLVLAEVLWWTKGLARLAWRGKRWLVVWGVAVLLFRDHELIWALASPAGIVVLLALWCRVSPASYARVLSGPLWRRRVRRRIRREWSAVMSGCGLTRRDPTGVIAGPGLVGVRWDRQGLLWITPALMVGQTVEDLEGAAERLRTAVGAHRLRVVPDSSHTACQLVCTFGEFLATSFLAAAPARGASVAAAPERLVLGRTEDGRPWLVDLRVCTLTAGSSGAGKGSVMWSLMLGLAPAIRAGFVEVHGVDLKGGMELGLGRALFARYAERPDQAVTLLEEAVTACEQRAASMAGVSRLHTPTAAAPLVLVLIDELASLTAYLPDRDLLRRGEVALARLCSIGRAPGYVVWGFLQDPRKETIKARHLFTQTIGLRLRDREESAMVLGDGALAAGAACHRISRSTPGIGYALDEGGRLTQVRAGWVSDDAIRAVAAAFPAPRQQAVVVHPVAASPSRARAGSRGVAA
jgi:S-DNA-T family DNA segregation ATPase FtsK/SpoIIIE